LRATEEERGDEEMGNKMEAVNVSERERMVHARNKHGQTKWGNNYNPIGIGNAHLAIGLDSRRNGPPGSHLNPILDGTPNVKGSKVHVGVFASMGRSRSNRAKLRGWGHSSSDKTEF
jgi:hypothetical protein